DEVVWSWRLARGVESALGSNLWRRRRWQEKSDHRGEHEVSVKTIAQGKPGVPSVSASACARTFFLRARLWVQWAPGFLCTLSIFLKGAAFLASLGRKPAARWWTCVCRAV